LRVLSVGGKAVKKFREPADNQEAILAAFEEEGWPVQVDDPIPPRDEVDPKERLHFTIAHLNEYQEHELIKFHGDGTGEAVRWAPVTDGEAER
jgi:hypothetical protein